MKQIKKVLTRSVALLLSAAMCVTSVTVPAAADEGIVTAAAYDGTQPDEKQGAGKDDRASVSAQLGSLNTLGSLLNAQTDMNEAGAVTDESYRGSYGITNVEVKDNIVMAALYAEADCSLMIGIYNDSGERMLMSGTTVVHKDDEAVGVKFDSLPEHYLVKAYLIDPNDGSPMCASYDNDDHTEAVEAFNKLTTDDFPKELVHNFDDDKTDNFMVYREDVVRIPRNKGYNQVKVADDDKRIYIIENADNNVKSLKKGENFSLEYGKLGLIMAKVRNISAVGNTVTVEGEKIELDDILGFTKINVETGSAGVMLYEDAQKIKQYLYSDDETCELLVDEDNEPDAALPEEETSEDGIDIHEGELDFEVDFNVYVSLEWKNGEKVPNVNLGYEFNPKYINETISLGDADFHLNPEKEGKINLTGTDECVKKTQDALKKLAPDPKEGADKLEEATDEEKKKWISGPETEPETSFEIAVKSGITIHKIGYSVRLCDIGETIGSYIFDDNGIRTRVQLRLNYDTVLQFLIKASFEDEITLVKFSIVPLLAFGVDLSISLVLGVEANIEISFKITRSYNLIITALQGDPLRITGGPTEEPNIELEVKGTLTVWLGLKVAFGIAEVPDLIDISLTAKFGVELEASVDKCFIDDDSGHDCNVCIGISMQFFFELDAEEKFFFELIDEEQQLLKIDIGDPMYCHLSWWKDGSWDMGIGECTNYTKDCKLVICDRDGDTGNTFHINIYRGTFPNGSLVKDISGKNGDVVEIGLVAGENYYFTMVGSDAYPNYNFIGKKDTSWKANPGIKQNLYVLDASLKPWKVMVKDADTGEFIKSGTVKVTDSCKYTTYIREIKFTDGAAEIKHISNSAQCEFWDDENLYRHQTYTISYIPQRNGLNYESVSLKKSGSKPVTDENFTFIENDDGKLTITGYKGTDKDVTIPSQDSGKTVSEIGESAFSGTNITSVKIPDTIVQIGSYAFSECASLATVTFGRNVGSIGKEAFCKCTSLTEIELPAALTKAGSRAFADCTSLKTVEINSELTSAQYMFSGCDALDGNALTYAGKTIPPYMFYGCAKLSALSFIDKVTEIGTYAFYGCDSVKTLKLGNSLTELGSAAFSHCAGLTSVELPASLTAAGSYAFSSCEALNTVTIKSQLTEAQYMFSGCKSLDGSRISFASGTTAIPVSMFRNCTGLTAITLPSSVTEIGAYAFSGCKELTSISPTVYEKIGTGAFNKCDKLKVVPTATEDQALPEDDLYAEELPEPTGAEIPEDPDEPAPAADNDTPAACSFTVSNMLPNETYMFYRVKTIETDELFSRANVLYAYNVVSDAKGTVSLTYIPTGDDENAVEFIAHYDAKKNIGNAVITIPDRAYNGKYKEVSPTVVYNGEKLVPERDYKLSGYTNTRDPGKYTVVVTGIGEYTGVAYVTYKITGTKPDAEEECSHENAVDITVAATVSAGGCTLRYCPGCGDVTRTAETLAMPEVSVKLQGTDAVLSWKEIDGSAGYEIYEGDTRIADIGGTSYTVTGVSDVLRTFRVRAVSTTLNYADSAEISVITPGIYLINGDTVKKIDSISAAMKEFKKEKTTGFWTLVIGKDTEEKSLALTDTASWRIVTANGAVLKLGGNALAIPSDTMIDADIVQSKGKAINLKVAKGASVIINKPFAAGTISGTATSYIALNCDMTADSITTFVSAAVNNGHTLTVNKKLNGIGELNGNVKLSGGAAAAKTTVGTAFITVVKISKGGKTAFPKTVLTNIRTALYMAFADDKGEYVKLSGGETVLNTEKEDLTKKVFIVGKSADGRKLGAFLYKKEVRAEYPGALTLNGEKCPSWEHALSQMKDPSKDYTVILNGDLSAAKFALPAKAKSLTIIGCGATLDLGKTRSITAKYPLTLNNVTLTAGTVPTAIKTGKYDLTVTDVSAGALTTGGRLTVNGTVIANGAVSCAELNCTETDTHLTLQSLAVTGKGITSGSEPITLKLVGKDGKTPVQLTAGGKNAVVAKTFKGPYSVGSLLLDSDCGKGTITLNKNKLILE